MKIASNFIKIQSYYNPEQKLFYLMQMIVFIVLVASPVISNGYSHELQAEYKGGTRHIGRLNLLTPIWQKPKHLLYLDLITVLTSKDTQEGNLGVGYRQVINRKKMSFIAGSYLFYDIQNTKHSNNVHQIAGGMEFLSTLGEIRVNGYLPLSKTSFNVGEVDDAVTHDGKNVYFGKKNKVEKILGGFDVEVGYKIPRIPVNTYLGYYRFSKKKITMHGSKIRIEYKPLQWLVAGGEYSYDKERKHNWYVNIGMRVSLFSEKEKLISPFSLEGKMTQVPVRDIDIVATDVDELHDIKMVTQVSTPEELQKAIQEGKTEIAITRSMNFGGEVITDKYGSPLNPIKNTIIAGIIISKKGSTITGVDFYPVMLSNYVVKQDASAPIIAVVDGDDVVLSGALFPCIDNTTISYLVLDKWGVDSAAMAQGSGLVGWARNNSRIHHVENRAELNTDDSSGIIWVAEDTVVENNSNIGRLTAEGSVGITRVATKKSILRNNINNGEVFGEDSTGIVTFLIDDSSAQNNINKMNVIGYLASGIVSELYGNSYAQNNINEGDITGSYAVGIAHELYESSSLQSNMNIGDVIGDFASGITALMRNGSVAQGNTNRGEVSGPSASGIARVVYNGASLENSINRGKVSGQSACGIVRTMFHTSSLLNNKNRGEVSGVDANGIVRRLINNSSAHGNINRGAVTGPNAIGFARTDTSSNSSGNSTV